MAERSSGPAEPQPPETPADQAGHDAEADGADREVVVNGAGHDGGVNGAGARVNGSGGQDGAVHVNGVNGAGVNGANAVNGVGGRVISLDDETVSGDDPDGPPPRPAPRYDSDRSVNGAFDDRTGLFEGPPGADVTGEPTGHGPSFTPPEGVLGGRFGSSAFRAVPDIDHHPRPPQPPPVPRRNPDPLPDLTATDLTATDASPAPRTSPAAVSPSADSADQATGTAADPAPSRRRAAAAADSGSRRAPSSSSSSSTLRLAALAVAPALTGLLAAWLVVTALLRLFSHAFSSLLFLIVGGGVLYGLVVAANRVRNTQPARLVGADLLPGQHPRIWALTAELAERTGVAPLTRIVVDGGTSVLVSRGPEHRELVIGLPLLIGLDEQELRALIARELVAERSPDDAGGHLHRLGPRLERALGTLRPGAARWLLSAYLWLYRQVAGPENERHDRWCDEQVTELSGGALEAARHRIGTTEQAWQIMLDEYLPLSSPAGRRPSLADAMEQILATRFAGAPGRGPSATTLLDGGPEAVRVLEGSILVDDDPRAGWDEIVSVASRAQAELAAARLARAALTTTFTDRSPDQPVTLAELLTALTRGQGAAMVEPLLRPAIPAEERPAEAREVLGQHVGAFVTLVLLREGLARHALNWSGPPVTERLERAGELEAWLPWDLDELVAEAAAGDAGPLTARLRELGADLERAVSPAPVPPPRVLSAFADVELCGPFEARRIDLLIYDNGLLLAPAPPETPLRRIEQQVGRLRLPGSVSAADRVVRLAEQWSAAPGSLPGGWWIEQPDITMGQLRERRTGMELQLRMADGAGATIRATPTTSLRGTPVDDLTRMLPDAAG